MEVGRKRDPDPRHKGARLSESAGKKEEKDGEARQGPNRSQNAAGRRKKKQREEGPPGRVLAR